MIVFFFLLLNVRVSRQPLPIHTQPWDKMPRFSCIREETWKFSKLPCTWSCNKIAQSKVKNSLKAARRLGLTLYWFKIQDKFSFSTACYCTVHRLHVKKTVHTRSWHKMRCSKGTAILWKLQGGWVNGDELCTGLPDVLVLKRGTSRYTCTLLSCILKIYFL